MIVLGLLVERGPMHGHAIRRAAEAANVEAWAGVSIGSLYRELHQLEQDRCIEAVLREQVGARPARTVYAATKEGRRELQRLGDEVVASFVKHPDPLGVALLFASPSTPGSGTAERAKQLARRRATIEALLSRLRASRARLELVEGLEPIARAVFRRGELLLEGELAWHDEYGDRLSECGDRTDSDDETEGAVTP